MTPGPDPTARAPLAPVAWPAALAAAALALGFGVGLHQLARSNRPHELTAAPFAAAAFAGAVALSILALARLMRAWRGRARRPLGAGHALLAVLLVPLTALSALLLLVAGETALGLLAG